MNPQIVSIERIDSVTPEIIEAFQHLLPQVSASAPTIGFEWLERAVANPANAIFVARTGEKSRIVGALTVVLMEIPSGMRAWLEDVVVDEAVRGLGVGSALLSSAIKYVQAVGARTLDLTSNPTRAAAHRLYERAGFVVRETRVYRHSLK